MDDMNNKLYIYLDSILLRKNTNIMRDLISTYTYSSTQTIKSMRENQEPSFFLPRQIGIIMHWEKEEKIKKQQAKHT